MRERLTKNMRMSKKVINRPLFIPSHRAGCIRLASECNDMAFITIASHMQCADTERVSGFSCSVRAHTMNDASDKVIPHICSIYHIKSKQWKTCGGRRDERVDAHCPHLIKSSSPSNPNLVVKLCIASIPSVYNVSMSTIIHFFL